MAAAISPGVYSKIIDLSEYIINYPSTIGFLPIISEKGRDNELVETNAEEYFVEFGEPNINYAGKAYSQGCYVADSFLRENSTLYVIRCLPSTATYSNLVLTGDPADALGTDGTCTIDWTSSETLSSDDAVDTLLSSNTSLVIFKGLGRGDYYDNYQIKISKHANPQLSDTSIIDPLDSIYILDIYQKQKQTDSDGNPIYAIITTFEVSFNPNKVDESGESMWIEDIMDRYSKHIKCVANQRNCYNALVNNGDFSIPFLNLSGTDPVTGAVSDLGGINLDNGDTGIFNTDGSVITTGANGLDSLLTKAYTGLLSKKTDGKYVDEVLDIDNYYFNIILDGGYPTNIKMAGIYPLVLIRKDCMAFCDNGDNNTYADALDARNNTHTFNTRYMALYESYSKIFDKWVGRDIWISPVYHIANVVAYTDNVGEVWDAIAGFNNATIGSIKELRFSPLQGQRDQFYLNQLNPLVKFNPGYTFWSQLTTQRKPSALQDIPIMRLVLYIKRALEQFCKFYIFTANDEQTRSAIKGEINRFLKQIQNRRGLYSYSVSVTANDYDIKAKQVNVDIMLEPVRHIEKIFLNFFIK